MASVEIYIKNYKAFDGTIVTTETLLQAIPMTGDPVITNPKVKTDIGKAGSFEFGLELNSPYYDAMLQMKTILRVVYFGETIFRGRVLTIDKSFARTRTIHCEGDLAFLIDSHQAGVKDESRSETDLLTYLSSVISQHNSDVSDPEKQFTLGEVPYSYSSSVLDDQKVKIHEDKAIQKYGSSSYDTSMDRLESLLSDFGGYMRTRYDVSSGKTYLDWYDNYYNPYTGQDVEVLSNLIDLSGPTEVENLFTVVLPIGKKDNGDVFINEWWPKVKSGHSKVSYITVPELATVPLYSDAELTSGYHRKEDYTNAISRFGRIWKTVEFENANTPQKLFTYCKDWIKNNFMPELTQWDVTALDLKFVGEQVRALYTGDRIKLVHPEVDQNYMIITIISSEYDLYNPDKNKFKIGVPNQQINASYGVKQKSKSKGGSVNSGITDLSSLTNDLEQQINGALEAIKRDRDILQQQYILKTTFGHDIGLDDPLAFLVYETDCITEKDPKSIAEATSKVIQKLEWTKRLNYPELVQSAWQKSLDTGLPPVPWDDLQNVIDNTFDIKQQQAAFKGQAMIHLTQDLGLPEDQAVDLLNDPSALYEAASLVDDNGNWTQKAIDKGALVWNQDRKALCVHAHKIVNNQGSSIGTNILGNSVGWLTGGSLDVNNYLSLDGLTNQFDLGNIINTQDFTDSLTGISEKVISMIGGQFDLSEITNTLTGLKNKAVSALGDLFSGTKIEDTVNNLTNKAVSFVDDLFNGTKIENTLTGVKDKAINFVGGLFSGSSKEKDGSADTDKSVNILSGLITGSDQETESTGEKRSFFDILGGLFTGGETKESSAAEATKTFFLGNGNAEIDGENGTAQFGEGYEWMVKINDTVKNVGGFVSAKDFQTWNDIPSFKTQFGAIKQLFADQAEINKANIQSLTALEAYIDKINANKVSADTLVSASYGRFSTLDVSGTVYLPYQTTYIETSDENNANVGKALNGCTSTFNDGHWKLSFSCLDGTSGPEPDFNLAESEWFQAQVSAKTNEGWDNASAEVSLPKAQSISDRTVTIRTPYSIAYGQETTRGTDEDTYTLQTYSKNEVCLNWDQGNNGEGTIVAVFAHNQYDAGQNDMDATGSWGTHSSQDTAEEKATNTFTYQACTTDDPPVAKGTEQKTTVTLSSGLWINNKKTVYLKEGNNQLAEFEVDASSLAPSGNGTITEIVLNPSNKVSYNSTSEMLTVNMQSSGTNITNSPFSDSDTLPVSATEVTLTKGDLSNTSTDTHGHTYAGRYYIKKNNGGVFKINQIDTIAASVAQHRLNLELSAPSATPFTWKDEVTDGADRYKYVYTVKSGLKASSGTDALANVLSYETETMRLDPTDAIEHGFDICHNSISLSEATQTLAAGKAVTIYPKAKASPSASEAESITDAGITITAEGVAAKISTSGWSGGKIKYETGTTGSDEVNIDLSIDVSAVLNGGDKTNRADIDVKDGQSSTGETRSVFLIQGTWNESTNKKTVQLRDGLTSGTVVAESEVDASTRYEAGQKSVKVTGASIEANSVVYSDGTARGTMNVRLSNMDADDPDVKLTGIILDDVYQAGLNGYDDYKTSADFEFDLTDGTDTWPEYFEDVPVGFIYNKGVEDRQPVVHGTYTYDDTGAGDLILIYKIRMTVLGTDFFDIDSSKKFYPNTPIVVDTSYSGSTNYRKVSYNGNTYYVKKENVIESESTTPSQSKYDQIGIWVEGTPTITGITLTRIVHTGYASSIDVHVCPAYESEKDIVSVYYTQSDYGALLKNAEVEDYMDLLPNTTYYGRHEAENYNGELFHKAVFTVSYSNDTTETKVVIFSSYARVADLGYYIYNDYGWTVSLFRSLDSSDYAYSGFLYPQTKVDVVSESSSSYQISYGGVTGWCNKSYVKYESYPSSSTDYPGKTGWAILSDVGYTYPVKIGVANTKLYRYSDGSTSEQTLSAGTSVIAETNPDNLPSSEQRVAVAYRKADHEIYLGYVDRANIGGADTGFTVTINNIYHSADDYDSEIPTTMILKDGAQRIVRSKNYNYNSYEDIPVSAGINISDFFNLTKVGCYGYYQLAAVADSEIYQKVNFTVDYSDGRPQQIYTCEFKSYKKTSSSEFVEGQIVYVYASNGNAVNVRTQPTSPSGTYGQLVPHTPVTIVSGPSSGYYRITYSQTGYNTVTGYMESQYLKDSVQGYSNYNYTGWKKAEPVKQVSGVNVRYIYHLSPAKDFSVFYTPKNGSRERVSSVYDESKYNSYSTTTTSYQQFFDELPKHYTASYSGTVTHKFVIDVSWSDGTTTKNVCFEVNSSN